MVLTHANYYWQTVECMGSHRHKNPSVETRTPQTVVKNALSSADVPDPAAQTQTIYGVQLRLIIPQQSINLPNTYLVSFCWLCVLTLEIAMHFLWLVV